MFIAQVLRLTVGAMWVDRKIKEGREIGLRGMERMHLLCKRAEARIQ